MKEYLFVYGAFRDTGNALLKDAFFCDKAFIYGRIYQVNDFYPGFIKDSGNNKVYGDIYLIDPSIFPVLDEYEGDEYIREKLWTSIEEWCWVYIYKYDVSNFVEIASGDWILRKNIL